MPRGTIELDELAASRLGQALARRRIERGHRSARALAREIGLDYRTITAIEAGRARSVERNTFTSLEVGLDWPAGHIDTLVAGTADDPLRLSAPDGIADDILARAKAVAQAAFDAALSQDR